LQTTKNSAGPREKNSLYGPSENGLERGGMKLVCERSLYTQAQLKPGAAAAIGVGIGVGILAATLFTSKGIPERALPNQTRRRRKTKG
jgi:hypothetical protein